VTLVRTAQALFPAGVTVAGGPVVEWRGALTPAEQAAVANAVPTRRAEFAAGRTAARAALGRDNDLPRRADGPPDWPAGWTGSITHGGCFCLAVVAPTALVRALGIDIEPAGVVTHDLVDSILTDDDRIHLGDRDPTFFFCAKEAAYKAQFMLTGQIRDFHDLSVRPDGADLRVTLPGMALRVRTAVAPGLIIAGTAIPA
jgi:4'-phosphopantetheinyl transferase EntD